MKFVSWNVNGLRACVKKGFMDFFQTVDADVFCIQETKMQREQGDLRCRTVLSIGTLRKRRDIRVLLFFLKLNR